MVNKNSLIRKYFIQLTGLLNEKAVLNFGLILLQFIFFTVAVVMNDRYLMCITLDYSSTVPFLYEKLNPGYKSYNYGVSSWAPSQIALSFNNGANIVNRETIEEPDGFALYSFIDNHLDSVYGTEMFNSPNVYIENDTFLIKPRSKNHFILDKLSGIKLFKALGLRTAYPETEEFYGRFASIINYIAEKYWEINPQGAFYVAIMPDNKKLEWLKFLNKKIKVLQSDTPSDWNSNREKYHIGDNAHLNRTGNTYYVEEITRLINSFDTDKIQ